MSQFTEGNRITRKAGADLTDKQYYIVKQDSSGDIVLATAGTDKILGTLLTENTDDHSVEVYARNASGTGKVVASTSIAINALITATTGGKAVTTTTAGDHVLGIALEAATSANQVIEYMPMTMTVPA